MDSYHCYFSSHLLRPNWSRELPKPHLLGTLSKRRPLKRKRDPEGDLLCLLLRRPHPFPSGEGRHRAGYDLLCPLPHPSPHTHPHVLLPARGKECEPELCQQLLLSSGHNILWAPVQQLWLSMPTSRGGKQPSADDREHLRSRPPNPRPLRPAPPCWGNAWGEGGDRGEVEAQALLPLQRHLHVGQRHHPQHHQLRPKDLSTKRSHPDSWDWVYKQFENLPARWTPFYFQYHTTSPQMIVIWWLRRTPLRKKLFGWKSFKRRRISSKEISTQPTSMIHFSLRGKWRDVEKFIQWKHFGEGMSSRVVDICSDICSDFTR